MGIDDVKKQKKLEPATDINELMNSFIDKVAQTVSNSQFIDKKDLLEIRDILIKLKQVDKTIRYTLFPSTVTSIKKAMQEVGYDNIDSIKDDAPDIEKPLDKIFKLEENELPQTDRTAREKYNEIVNTQLDQTIKTINEITQVERPDPEGLAPEELGLKIIREIFVSILSSRLKELRDVVLPTDKERKNEDEVDLNRIRRGNKNLSETPEIEEKRLKSFDEIDEIERKSEKEFEEVGEASKTSKFVFRLDSLPSVSNKLQREVVAQIDKEEKNENEFIAPENIDKSSIDTPRVSEQLVKERNDLNQPDETEKLVEDVNYDNAQILKEIQDVEPSVDKPIKEENIPDTTNQVDKEIELVDIDTSRLLTTPDKEAAPENVVNPPWASRKKGVTPWYENLKDNVGLGQTNVTAFGFALPVGGTVGSTLALFGVTTSELTRAANKARRTLNTGANSFEITTALTSIFAAQKIDGSKPGIGDQRLLTQEDLQTTSRLEPGFEGDVAGGIVTTNFDYEGYWQKVDRKGALINGENASTTTIENFLDENDLVTIAEPGATPVPFDYARYLERIEKKISALKDETASRMENRLGTKIGDIGGNTIKEPGTSDYYKNYFKNRTISIVNKRATGYLKIYLLRGPGFADSQSSTEIIPFQFEPVISGDSKSADYAQISTLARSQAAQVYRRSQERNITLNLEYVVTGPSSDSAAPAVAAETIKQSKSAEGMEAWDEEYIYGYILRNLRNLALPNIVGQGYKLAPPIVQIWYGDLEGETGTSTGVVTDPDNIKLSNVHPALRTNWYTAGGQQSAYRSLWVCKTVGFEYKGGIINRISRHNVQVTVSLQLTEIAPSVTANEILVWRKLTG